MTIYWNKNYDWNSLKRSQRGETQTGEQHCKDLILEKRTKFRDWNLRWTWYRKNRKIYRLCLKWSAWMRIFFHKIKTKLYLLSERDLPYWTLQSKRFITKVMFLTALARMRLDPHRKNFLGEKIRIWPWVEKVPAQRSSKNRKRGTVVSKTFEINGEKYCKLIPNQVIPAIKEKWPAGSRGMKIVVQRQCPTPQDGWSEHVAGSRSNVGLIQHFVHVPTTQQPRL